MRQWSLLSSVEALRQSLFASIQDIKTKLCTQMPKISGMQRKWLAVLMISAFGFKSLLEYPRLGPVFIANRRVVSRIMEALHWFYFRFGVELTNMDDKTFSRRLDVVSILITTFLPAYMLYCIVKSCTVISHLSAPVLSSAIVTARLEDAVDEKHSGWSSGGDLASGIVISRLSVTRRGIPRVSDLSLTISPGEITVLSGNSASGRSDVLRALWGTAGTRRSGSINMLGRDLNDWDTDYIRSRMVYLRAEEPRLGLVAGALKSILLK